MSPHFTPSLLFWSKSRNILSWLSVSTLQYVFVYPHFETVLPCQYFFSWEYINHCISLWADTLLHISRIPKPQARADIVFVDKIFWSHLFQIIWPFPSMIISSMKDARGIKSFQQFLSIANFQKFSRLKVLNGAPQIKGGKRLDWWKLFPWKENWFMMVLDSPQTFGFTVHKEQYNGDGFGLPTNTPKQPVMDRIAGEGRWVSIDITTERELWLLLLTLHQWIITRKYLSVPFLRFQIFIPHISVPHHQITYPDEANPA